MSLDFDLPRPLPEDDDEGDESLEALRADSDARRYEHAIDDEANVDEDAAPGEDRLGEVDLTVPVLPRQADEFVCSRCFLLYHRSRQGRDRDGQTVCRDCD